MQLRENFLLHLVNAWYKADFPDLMMLVEFDVGVAMSGQRYISQAQIHDEVDWNLVEFERQVLSMARSSASYRQGMDPTVRAFHVFIEAPYEDDAGLPRIGLLLYSLSGDGNEQQVVVFRFPPDEHDDQFLAHPWGFVVRVKTSGLECKLNLLQMLRQKFLAAFAAFNAEEPPPQKTVSQLLVDNFLSANNN